MFRKERVTMEYDLVFEGGGAKGMSFVGALQAFDKAGHTPGRLLGTSAGAITATALAAGYTPKEIADALLEQVGGHSVFKTFLGEPAAFSRAELDSGALRRFLEDVDLPLPDAIERRLDAVLLDWMANNPKFRNLLSFVERGGWYSADAFVAWLSRLLDEGEDLGKPRRYSGMTLKELHDATKRDLTLVAADVTDGRMLILNHRTAPDLPVVWAARMSMSVPLLWQEVIWKPEWGGYRKRTAEQMTDHAIVDGGLLSNFPIALLLSDDKVVTDVMGPRGAQPVAGFLIDETLVVPNAPDPPGKQDPSPLLELSTVQRLKRLADTATQAHDKAAIDEFEYLVARLPAKTYGTTEFDMLPERREALIAAGYDVAEKYFKKQAQGAPGGALSELPPGAQSALDAIATRQALQILDE
jgi:predicted acylesterase/phospholipase RssA